MAHDNYTRNGTALDVIDGDSLRVMVDLGFRVWHKTHVRLLGIDSPERGETGWAEARAALIALVPHGSPVIVETEGPDKYGGRWLAHVYAVRAGQPPLNVGMQLVAEGFAVPYHGGARS